ncbi:MAG: dinitrogenase iron-molybdenum cofactor [Proteobacteria bacterium]|nr:dinitrogenase iron-molybdenum cofactor [Desulfobacula sp.]MBU3953230.1 dinitrogenase iron-molybdenum cofactor [Pseudomonadota bacterium]MBU4129678.1 dinitrogenase iron-molybdenum cofactor [Pseudomonadota bacterium]
MKVAFPVKKNNGLKSLINEHFGVVEEFLIVDLDTRTIEVAANQKLLEKNASCKTGVFDKETAVDAVVTCCIGDGSLRGLNSANIKVYAAQGETISENLDLLEKNQLKLYHIFDLCQGKKNKKEGGCGHHH